MPSYYAKCIKNKNILIPEVEKGGNRKKSLSLAEFKLNMVILKCLTTENSVLRLLPSGHTTSSCNILTLSNHLWLQLTCQTRDYKLETVVTEVETELRTLSNLN